MTGKGTHFARTLSDPDNIFHRDDIFVTVFHIDSLINFVLYFSVFDNSQLRSSRNPFKNLNKFKTEVTEGRKKKKIYILAFEMLNNNNCMIVSTTKIGRLPG